MQLNHPIRDHKLPANLGPGQSCVTGDSMHAPPSCSLRQNSLLNLLVFALDALPLNSSPWIKFRALEILEAVVDAQSFIVQHSFTTIII